MNLNSNYIAIITIILTEEEEKKKKAIMYLGSRGFGSVWEFENRDWEVSFARLNPDPDRVNTASRNLEEEKKIVKKINAAISSRMSSCLYIHHARANHITNYLFSFIHLFTLQFYFLFFFIFIYFFLDFDFLYLKLYSIYIYI